MHQNWIKKGYSFDEDHFRKTWNDWTKLSSSEKLRWCSRKEIEEKLCKNLKVWKGVSVS